MTDGSPGCTLSINNNDHDELLLVECTQQSGSPVNVYFNTSNSSSSSSHHMKDDFDDNSSGCFFWQATLDAGHDQQKRSNVSSMGLVDVSKQHNHFQPGYKIRGLFYNGNLTNGTAALQTAFGDYLQPGDTVGVLLEKNKTATTASTNSRTETRVYFYLNGKCLGLAFLLTKDSKDDAVWRPCLQLNGGSARVSYRFPKELPTDRERSTSQGASGSIVGAWKLTKAVVQNEMLQLPTAAHHREIELNIKQDSNEKETPVSFGVSLRVGNLLGTNMRVLETQNNTNNNNSSFRVQSMPVRATMMMPPPELQLVEAKLTTCLSTAFRLTCSDHGNSLIIANDGNNDDETNKTFELEFEPLEKRFAPLTEYL